MAYLGKLVKCNQTKRAICKAIRIGGVEFHDIVRQFETCHQGHCRATATSVAVDVVQCGRGVVDSHADQHPEQMHHEEGQQLHTEHRKQQRQPDERRG